MKNRKGLAWLFALVAVLSLLASACGSSDNNSSAKSTTTKAAGDTATTAGADTAAFAKLSGKLDGQGSSFQDTFEQQVSSDFGTAVKDAGGSATVTYTKTGSSDGKKALGDGTVGFAGSDSAIKPEEKAAFGSRKILYFPIVGGPISLAYKLKGVAELNLSPATIAGIYQGTIKTWDDAAIAKDNPDAKLPSTAITVVHRSDGSGTTSNFTKFLAAAAPDTFKLTPGEEVTWPTSSNFQGGEKSTGVISIVKSTDGAIGYADLADAAKEGLDVARVGNAKGEFIQPSPDAASAALAGAEVADDLTYNPLNVDATGAYPITSPTWILVDAKQKDKATADLVKAYLNYVLTTGQTQAKDLLYAPLPEALATKAIAQLDSITVG
ncbi:MAG: phosphate transporter periplasmic phosphate-binding protein [Acidimicrobiales bacterium]|nr:phosphate transporter periplasmic phosphate-binding protein [Acidimicrobiales bacterium]